MGAGGEQAPEPFPWIRHCQLSLSHKTFFCFQGPNYYSQEKKRQKSENRFTHNVSALVVTNTLWPASFFLTLAHVSWKSDKKHHSLDEVPVFIPIQALP